MESGQNGGSSVSLEDFAGEQFGDFNGSETPEASDTSSAAAPPAEHAPDGSESTTGPEGTAAAEHPSTPSADAAPVAPDAGAPPVADDPFKDAKPATYMVDGQERTYDGIKVLGEDGAVIEAANLPDVLRRLGERDHLVDVNQRQYAEAKALEPLTSWKTTGDDGKEVTLTGQQGLMAMHVEYARMSQAVAIADALLSDPTKILGLLAQDKDGKVVVDPSAVETLQMRIALAANGAETQTRSRLSGLITEASKPAPVPINFEAEAPRLIRSIAGQDFAKLTPADQKFLADQLPIYTNGKTVNLAYEALVKDRIALRAEAVKTGAVVTDAAKQNAANLAAAARGLKPVAAAKVPVRKPSAQQEHDTSRVSDADAGFELLQNLTGGRRR